MSHDSLDGKRASETTTKDAVGDIIEVIASPRLILITANVNIAIFWPMAASLLLSMQMSKSV